MGVELPTCVSRAYLALRIAERIDYKGIDVIFNNYQFNGIVNVISVSPYGRIYLGGDFILTQNVDATIIRHNAAAFSDTGVLQSWNPSPNGPVNTIAISIFGETIYIGGVFNNILNEAGLIIERQNIVALSVKGQIQQWNHPEINGSVNALAILDESIYIGGKFTCDNQNNAVAFNTQGEIQGWNPSPNGVVNAIAVLGENIYIGGKFSLVNQDNVSATKISRSNTASFDKNGVLLDWSPNPNGDVNTIAVSDNIIYIGGTFTKVSSPQKDSDISRINSAAFDINGNVIHNWNPSPNGTINTISILNGNIYIGGRFSEVGTNDARLNVAAYNNLGELQNWNPSPRNISDNLSIIKSIIASGNSVYIGGDFETIDNISKTTIANVNAKTGNLIGLPEPTLIFNNYQIEGIVNAISVARDGSIYIGGDFELTENNDNSGYIRRNTAAFNTNGTLLSWNPSPNGSVYAIAISEPTIYIGGQFTTINNQSRFNIAAINADGTLLEWNPSPRNSNNDSLSQVNAISVLNSIIYIGGGFKSVTNETGQLSTRNNTVAFSDTGVLQTWNPSPNGEVYAIAILNDIIYVGGFFSIVNENNVAQDLPTENRQSVAAFTTTGVLQQWNPTPNGPVYAIGVLGETIYLGGQFDSVKTTTIISRKNAAAFDISGDLIQTWNPSPNGIVNAIAVSGLYIYIGGEFDKVQGVSDGTISEFERIYAASFSINGELQSWEPLINGPVKAIAISSFNIYIGGFFYNVPDYSPQIAIKEVNPITGVSSQIQSLDLFYENNFDGSIHAITVSPSGVIYVGGLFKLKNNNGDTIRTNIAAFNDTGLIQQWNPLSNGIVYAIALLGENVYIGGKFEQININGLTTVSRINAAALKSTGELLPWNPSPRNISDNALSVVNAIAILGDNIYIGGQFASVNTNNGIKTESRLNAAAFTADGILLDWNPAPFNDSAAIAAVYTIATQNNIIYIGGLFEKVNSFNGSSVRSDRKNIAVFNTAGQIQSWDPSPNGVIYAITIYSNTVYIGGKFNSIKSANTGFIKETRLNTAAFFNEVILDWNPSPFLFGSDDATVNNIVILGENIYICGIFDTLNTNNGTLDANNETTGTRNNIAAFSAGEQKRHRLLSWTPPKTSAVNTIAFSELNIYIGLNDPVSQFTSGSMIKLPNPLEIYNTKTLINSIFNRYDISTDAVSGVNAITSFNGNVYIGGKFSITNNRNKVIRINAAAFDFNGELLEWNPSPNGVVNTITTLGSNIYIGGDFNSVNKKNTNIDGTDTRNNAAAFNSDGILLDWNPSPNGAVHALASVGTVIYIGGIFETVSNVNIPRNNAAAFDNAGVLQNWNPSPNGVVKAIAILNDIVYIGGRFTSVSANNISYVRSNAAAVEVTGAIFQWNPQPTYINVNNNSAVNTIEVLDGNIYIGGRFNRVNNDNDSTKYSLRNNAATFTVSGKCIPWNPSPDTEFIYVTANDGIHVYDRYTNESIIVISLNYLNVGELNNKTDIAVSPDGSKVYITNFNLTQSRISFIDVSKLTTYDALNEPLLIDDTVQRNPSSPIFSPDGKFLYFIGNGNSIVAINTTTNTLEALLLKESDNFKNLSISPDGKIIYATKNNALTIITIPDNGSIANATQVTINNIGQTIINTLVSPDGKILYIVEGRPLAGSNKVIVLDTSTNAILRLPVPFSSPGTEFDFPGISIINGKIPVHAVISHDGRQLYLADSFGDLIVIPIHDNTFTQEIIQKIITIHSQEVSGARLAISTDDNRLYLSVFNKEVIYIIDTISQISTGSITMNATNTGFRSMATGSIGFVNSIATSGEQIYIGGQFSRVIDNVNEKVTISPRKNTAAFDSKGILQEWNPKPNNVVNAISGSGPNIYIGGLFSNLNDGSIPKNAVVEVDSTSGIPLGLLQSQIAFKNYVFSSISQTLAQVFTLKVSSDNTLYVGGQFNLSDVRHKTNILRSYVAAFSKDGSLLPWNPAPNGVVNVIVEANNIIYIGGFFSSVNELNGFGNISRINRSNIAAFHTSGEIVKVWDPSPNGVVNAIAVLNNTVYFGGGFTTVKNNEININHTNIAAFSVEGVFNNNWGLDSSVKWALNTSVLAIATLDDIIYIGADTGTGDATLRALAFNTNGIRQEWNPKLNNSVNTITTYDGGTSSSKVIFIGGDFYNTIFGQTPYFGVAAFKPNGDVFGWNPAPSISSTPAVSIKAIAIYPTPNNSGLLQIYIGGEFNQLRDYKSGEKVKQATNAATIGFLLPDGGINSGIVLTPVKPEANNTVRAIAFSSGLSEQRVYYGGLFNTLNSISNTATGTTDLSGNLI